MNSRERRWCTVLHFQLCQSLDAQVGERDPSSSLWLLFPPSNAVEGRSANTVHFYPLMICPISLLHYQLHHVRKDSLLLLQLKNQLNGSVFLTFTLSFLRWLLADWLQDICSDDPLQHIH